ncbi:MAG: hypothetical protein M3125_01360 [Gemmatimonadota bacterium]|nr:hypothetical protein [Gemmatimonadota bacterium]
MRTEYVITLEQNAQGGAAAAAEARAAAQQVRIDAERIREEAQRIREEVRAQIHDGMHPDPNPNPEAFVVQVPPTPPWMHPNDIPPHVVEVISMFLFAAVIIIVGLPIARAIGRWMDRRGTPAPVNAELAAQITRIEQAVDTMSVEVERISEAQRFQAKLLSDREKVRA